MRPDKQVPPKVNTGRKRRMNWDLYYYEQQGNRFYKRYTPFALILTIIGCLLILIFLITGIILKPRGSTNVNITVPPSPSPSNASPLRPTSPASLPNTNRQSKPGLPVQPSPPTSDKNANERLAPQQTPPAQPSTPPP